MKRHHKKGDSMHTIAKAALSDVAEIHQLIMAAAEKQQMLARSLQSIYENLRAFVVCRNRAGDVIGCCALQIVWNDMAEIRSLVVLPRYKGKGIGAALVESCMNEARVLGIPKVFTLTYVPEFFKKQGFKAIDKNKLPHKIWADCIHCPHFPDCDEVALLRVVH